jgi:acetyltransferase-like isoleucine patch superfamily enzyme
MPSEHYADGVLLGRVKMNRPADLWWDFRARTGGSKYQPHWRQLLSSGRVAVGRHTEGIPRVDTYRVSGSRVTIGNLSTIGPEVVTVTGGTHQAVWVSTVPFRARWQMPGVYRDNQLFTRGDVNIGSDVWVGTGALILSGVSVGHGAEIAARAVVTKDVPPFSVVAGNPARIVRYRFSAGQIEAVLRIAWWHWRDEWIREHVPLLSSSNVDCLTSECGLGVTAPPASNAGLGRHVQPEDKP